jgi:hypothetical protein
MTPQLERLLRKLGFDPVHVLEKEEPDDISKAFHERLGALTKKIASLTSIEAYAGMTALVGDGGKDYRRQIEQAYWEWLDGIELALEQELALRDLHQQAVDVLDLAYTNRLTWFGRGTLTRVGHDAISAIEKLPLSIGQAEILHHLARRRPRTRSMMRAETLAERLAQQDAPLRGGIAIERVLVVTKKGGVEHLPAASQQIDKPAFHLAGAAG